MSRLVVVVSQEASANSLTLVSMSSVNIEIWSDIACPWCWVGKRSLEGFHTAERGHLRRATARGAGRRDQQGRAKIHREENRAVDAQVLFPDRLDTLLEFGVAPSAIGQPFRASLAGLLLVVRRRGARKVSALQPNFSAIELIAAHSELY